MDIRQRLKDKKRIVIKIGSSSLTHEQTGELNLGKIERMIRQIADLKGMGKEIVLVSSGAIATGKQALGYKDKPDTLAKKQALAAVGQARLMMVYQRIFSEYNMVAAQILMTKSTIDDIEARNNAKNTFNELLGIGAIPIVNENDTVSTYEIRFGDNDRLSAIVSHLIDADLLILLSDIDGLFSDDPKINKNARLIETVEKLDENLISMAKDTSSSSVGTGGMSAKLVAAKIATYSGIDMIIANAKDIEIIGQIISGENKGTIFLANKMPNYTISEFIN